MMPQRMSPQGNGRLAVSISALAVLALLAWRTMEAGKAQQLTWLLLGFFALRIVIAWLRSRRIEREPRAEIAVASTQEG